MPFMGLHPYGILFSLQTQGLTASSGLDFAG
jgi:hypothetical protein